MILDRHSFGIWSFVAKRAFKTTFRRPEPHSAKEAIKETLRGKREIGIYIHIPFCERFCTYCAYVRYLARDPDLISRYIEALKAEIGTYGELLRDLNLKIAHIHVGGGTPSLLDGSQFKEISNSLTKCFGSHPGIAIEANPNDLVNKEKAFELVNHGVGDVSLGVQSFNPDTLRRLGRPHGVEESLQAIENLRRAGARHINMDLMYMVPGQSLGKWVEDLEQAAEQDVDEITCYPTLITEHCPGFKLIKKGRVNQPDKRTFRRMVYAAEDILSSKGFKPVEIYGYSRDPEWKYATVNYEMEGPLLGLGCGAMGFTGGYEYQNTCSVQEYIQSALQGDLPIAGARSVDIEELAIRYTNSRLLVSRSLDIRDFEERFGDFSELIGKSGFGKMLMLLRFLGYIKKREGKMELERRGLFTAHLICWAFVTNVPCGIAREFLKTPWPNEVTIP